MREGRRSAGTPGRRLSIPARNRFDPGFDRFAGVTAAGIPTVDEGPRGSALTAAVAGFAGVAWCGWAQVSADSWLSTLLTIGAVVGFVLAVLGFVRAANEPRSGTPLRTRRVRNRYLAVLTVEVVVGVAGLLGLALAGVLEWSPVWLCAVFGVHLGALARAVGSHLLIPAGAVLMMVALLSLVLSLTGLTAPATVAGAGAGLALLVTAVVALVARPAVDVDEV